MQLQAIWHHYQNTNLFFEDGQISAVIDWDQSYVAPRAWEVVRTLHYVCKLDGPLCRIFLTAYRDVLPLPPEELDLAAAVYGWMRGHDLWHYEAIYLEGNQRVRAFLQPGPYIPFAQKWATLRAYL
ncbi:phosphotransferase [Dictyobacter formicarum]|uniref:phosphotransferase n=1 Tax=Dictyobacter formicarum TaxID=2778368 RepID=UPI0019164300|nr:phosphotransferase [Dictyobacter formicarum]